MAVLRMGSAPTYSITQTKGTCFPVSILFGWCVARLTTECASDSGVGSGMDSWVYGGIGCGMDSGVYSGVDSRIEPPFDSYNKTRWIAFPCRFSH